MHLYYRLDYWLFMFPLPSSFSLKDSSFFAFCHYFPHSLRTQLHKNIESLYNEWLIVVSAFKCTSCVQLLLSDDGIFRLLWWALISEISHSFSTLKFWFFLSSWGIFDTNTHIFLSQILFSFFFNLLGYDEFMDRTHIANILVTGFMKIKQGAWEFQGVCALLCESIQSITLSGGLA